MAGRVKEDAPQTSHASRRPARSKARFGAEVQWQRELSVWRYVQSTKIAPAFSAFSMHYYNGARTHLSLNKDAPMPRAVQAVERILPEQILGGLHHQYVRI